MGLKDLLKSDFIEDKMDDLVEGLVDGAGEKIVEALEKLGPVPKDLAKKIMTEKNKDKLADWLKDAVTADSIDDFVKKMKK